MVLASICGCVDNSPEPAKPAVVQTEKRLAEKRLAVNTQSICDAFETNTGEYMIGRSVEVTGLSSRIEKDKEGDAYLKFITKPQWEMRAYVSEPETLNRYTRGDKVIASGRLKERVGNSINLVNCTIKPAPVDAKLHAGSPLGLSIAEATSAAESGSYAKDALERKENRLHGEVVRVAPDTMSVELAAPDGWVVKCYPERGQIPPKVGSILIVGGTFTYSQFRESTATYRPRYLQLKNCYYLLEHP